MNDEILIYKEVRPDGRRKFELRADRLLIRVDSFRATSDLTFILADFRPEPDRIRWRSQAFGLGVVFLAIALASLVAAAAWRGDPDGRVRWDVLAIASAPTAILGLAILARTARKIEFASFTARGGAARFDVARSGPDRGRFDEFVAAISRRIAAAGVGAAPPCGNEMHGGGPER